MAFKRNPGMESARAAVEEVFNHPPVNDAELSQRLRSINAADGRRVLMERLERSLVEEEELGLFLGVFKKLGIGEERERLMRLTADKQYDTFARTLAIAVLAEEDPEGLNAGIGKLDPDDIAQLADRPLIELLNSIESNPDNAEEISAFLLESPQEMRAFLLDRLGACRTSVGVPAVAVYSHALGLEQLAALHDSMIKAIVEEGGQDAIALLKSLRDRSANRQARQRFQAALMRLSTHAIDPKRDKSSSVAGSAYIGSCDGQGMFVLVGVFKKPNGSLTAAELCIRAAGDIRGGFVVTRQNQKEIKSRLRSVSEGSGCDFTSVSLDQAAWVVADTVERIDAQKLAIPADAKPAVNLLRPLFERGNKEKPAIEPAKKVTLAQARRLLKRPIYRYWFFDAADMTSAAVVPPAQERAASNRWFSSAAHKLDKPHMRARVVAIARHMAYWHAWRGESELSSQCEALARATESNFVLSPLVRAMLEQTLTAQLYEETPEMEPIGAPETRQYLKSLFFHELTAPTGKEMALLDLTEVALASLEQALAVVPGERRPRDDQKPSIAFSIANRYWELLASNRRIDVNKHMQEMLKELGKQYGFKKRECLELGAVVVYALARFADEVCLLCDLDCLNRPQADMSEAFFSPHHPFAGYDDDEEQDREEQLEFDDLWSQLEDN